MKQPLIQCNTPVKYKFKRLTPEGINVKDSCSFEWHDREFMICDNQTSYGLILYENIGGIWVEIKRLFEGWTCVWAPCVVEYNGKLILYFSDTGGGTAPYWVSQRIRYIDNFIPGNNYTSYQTLNLGHTKGVIDPELIQIGDKFYMFYVVMDWNYSGEGQWQWWDIYYSVADNPLGPYSECHNVSHCVEYGIEEAPFYNPYDGYFYYSVKDSVSGSFIRRGKLTMTNGILNIVSDDTTLIEAAGSDTCTHPDFWKGKLRATLIDKPYDQGGKCYIGEME
jgi:hypothetical protein